MRGLLNNDHNAINYSEFFSKKIIIKLPKGKLGIELGKIIDEYIIIDIHVNSKMKDILKIGDIVCRLNHIELHNKDVKELQLLFFKNITAKRLLTIYR